MCQCDRKFIALVKILVQNLSFQSKYCYTRSSKCITFFPVPKVLLKSSAVPHSMLHQKSRLKRNVLFSCKIHQFVSVSKIEKRGSRDGKSTQNTRLLKNNDHLNRVRGKSSIQQSWDQNLSSLQFRVEIQLPDFISEISMGSVNFMGESREWWNV